MDSNIKSSISFSAIFGDEESSVKLSPYLVSLEHELEEKMPISKYSEKLDFILLYLFVEGRHKWFDMPKKPKLMNYSEKNKDIAYQVPVTDENFWSTSPANKKEFLLQQVLDAITATRVRLAKKQIEVDFETMLNDYKRVSTAYRAAASPGSD